MAGWPLPGVQIRVVDAPACGCCHRRLGPEGDAEPSRLEHRQVVGAVADGQGRVERHAAFSGERQQRVAFHFAGHDRRGDGAGDAAIGNVEPVRDEPVEAEFCGDRLGEHGEPAGDQRGRHPGSAQGGEQGAGAGHQADARCRLGEHGFRQVLQQRDPFGESRGEIEFAIHRPAGDLGDMLAQPDEFGQFVEHLVFDDGRLQVSDEDALAAPGGGLDQNVDRRAPNCGARRGFGCFRFDPLEGEIAGVARRQPIRGRAQGRRERDDHIGQGRLATRPGD